MNLSGLSGPVKGLREAYGEPVGACGGPVGASGVLWGPVGDLSCSSGKNLFLEYSSAKIMTFGQNYGG